MPEIITPPNQVMFDALVGARALPSNPASYAERLAYIAKMRGTAPVFMNFSALWVVENRGITADQLTVLMCYSEDLRYELMTAAGSQEFMRLRDVAHNKMLERMNPPANAVKIWKGVQRFL